MCVLGVHVCCLTFYCQTYFYCPLFYLLTRMFSRFLILFHSLLFPSFDHFVPLLPFTFLFSCFHSTTPILLFFFYLCNSFALNSTILSLVSPEGSSSTMPEVENSLDGGAVQFTCTAQGGPGNEFVWRYLRTGETVSTTQQLDLTSDESVGGQYQCEVFNLAGNDTATVTLNG